MISKKEAAAAGTLGMSVASSMEAFWSSPYRQHVIVASAAVMIVQWLKNKGGLSLNNLFLSAGVFVHVWISVVYAPAWLMQLLDLTVFQPLYSACVERGWPSPRGLFAGLGMVLIWHLVVMTYYAARREMALDRLQYKLIHRKGFFKELAGHFTRPESFIMVYGYLCTVWMFKLLPSSYYNETASVNWMTVAAQFLVVDLFIWIAHWLEHVIIPLYKLSHKQHHKFVNPTLFDAFSGSIPDTFDMILVPLFATAWVLPLFDVHVSNWDFAAFGSIYANQFMLLHLEYRNPWDWLLEAFSIGTGEDHNVHHITFNYNYGHFLMIYDKIFGTYKNPYTVRMLCRSELQGKVVENMAALSSPSTSPIEKSGRKVSRSPKRSGNATGRR